MKDYITPISYIVVSVATLIGLSLYFYNNTFDIVLKASAPVAAGGLLGVALRQIALLRKPGGREHVRAINNGVK